MKKADHQTKREAIQDFQQIINIGPAFVRDFEDLGLESPIELRGKDPWQLYVDLCVVKQQEQDPCVLDVLIATVNYMDGKPPTPWWKVTAQRKRKYGKQLADRKAEAHA